MGQVSESRIPVWLDCDPGHDDAMAIILAGYSPRLRLLGISTVAGNQSLVKVTQNAIDVLEASGIEGIDVIAGQIKPLIRCPEHCPEIHGDTGLDGPQGGRLLPKSDKKPLREKAVIHMFRVIEKEFTANPQQHVSLICTGCLSNAALLIMLFPEVVDMVEITIMGGCVGLGNTGPVAEFNIQIDPEAAKVVFESGVPLTMVPLEVTHTVLVTHDVLAAVGSGAEEILGMDTISETACSHFRKQIQQLMLFFAATYKKTFGFDHPPLHDPVAVAAVICPEIFEMELMRVDIETTSSLSYGQTVCDKWGHFGRPKNCKVALTVDVQAFWRLMLAALKEADKRSPLNATS